jgi:hypothetical protein
LRATTREVLWSAETATNNTGEIHPEMVTSETIENVSEVEISADRFVVLRTDPSVSERRKRVSLFFV